MMLIKKMKLFLIVSCLVGLSTIWGSEADRALAAIEEDVRVKYVELQKKFDELCKCKQKLETDLMYANQHEAREQQLNSEIEALKQTLHSYRSSIEEFDVEFLFQKFMGIEKPERLNEGNYLSIIDLAVLESKYLKQENKTLKNNYSPKQMAAVGVGFFAAGIALTHLYKTGKFNVVLNPIGSMFTGVKNCGLGLTGFAGNALSKMLSRR